MTRPLRVCFHAPLLWPLWSGGAVPFTGGAEVQQARLARGLVGRGFEVVVVSCDFGQPAVVDIDGVKVIKTYRLSDGLPVARFFHPRLTRTLSALRAARADVYYCRGASLEAGVTYEAARGAGAAFVFAAAHDHDADPRLPLLRNPRDRAWYRRALRRAAAVVAQTVTQQRAFLAGFGRESEVIPNLVEMPPRAAGVSAAGNVLWIATYKEAKRPGWFIEAARGLPGLRFVMAGIVPAVAREQHEWEAAREAARQLPNLEVRGFVEHDELASLHQAAALFVHTSPAEGFPNTLLEAWAAGIPSVSLVDPDGVIARERMGETVRDPASLVAAVRAWMSEPQRRRAAGELARRYVAREHAPQAVLDRLGALVTRVAPSKS